ncbi:putative transcription factor bHLH041 isoform X1 [Cucurbita moschata]|uniref:Transcription factor bHLH041 isoform X1 n=1 Tax=Cucurbita moschata TaxID=3662 RepID=A0A6J1H8Y8_CUCMO|nr:putative transcription factor bHLH041 isoform X1 [Cucurbita moschata]
MEIAFHLHESHRHSFLQTLMHSFGCTYICLWSYLPQPSKSLISLSLPLLSLLYFLLGFGHFVLMGFGCFMDMTCSCLRFLDGLCVQEIEVQTCSSSAGSLAQLLFEEYRQLEFSVEDGLVPGLAHKHNDPCLKLEDSQLQTYASADIQRQFYLAARIQASIFLGSINGEIELGFSNVSQVDMQMIINLLPGDVVGPKIPLELPQPATKLKLIPSPSLSPIPNPNQLSSSTSSLRSQSMDSPAECSSLLLNAIQTTPHITEPFTADIPILPSQHQHSMDSIFAQARNLQFPTPEALDEAMTRTILAVLSSPAGSSSSSMHKTLEGMITPSYHLNVKASAFKKYARVQTPTTARLNQNLSTRQSLLKRSLAFMRNLNLMRLRERMPTASRPTTSQLHHVISERRRREKLNDSFQALKSLLPPGTKKDKGSVLTTTREYMSSLKAQVAELSRRNQQLEAQLLQSAKEEETSVFSQEERFRVGISQVSESTSEGQIIDLHITTRGESPLTDMVIGVLEFLKPLNNVRVVSMEGNTQLTPSSSTNHLTLRLIIEENEWDESAFREAVERVVSDLAR